eukprot:TRINITY_DN5526_c0_g1_i1.p2 TRINITY_DN5526_c0_g1~~TRINITY_DN5526_c0_g1_i1.p2  ORF type:complete len:291 (-),score=63.46 TRINITY_DN5526_c0_g1_i1:2530-3402(-)
MVTAYIGLCCLRSSKFTTHWTTQQTRICVVSVSKSRAHTSGSRTYARMSAVEGNQDEGDENVMQGPAPAPTKAGVSTVGLSEQESAFLEACYAADVDKIESLLNENVAVNTSDVNGRTALHFCAGNGLPTLCLKLIENGATIDKQDMMGFTPLHMAAGYIKVDTAKVLIEKGADANIASFAGKLPVEIAEEMLENTPAKRFFVANQNHHKLKQMVQVLDEATEVEDDDGEDEEEMTTVSENGEITEETENAKFVVRVKPKGERSESSTPKVKVDDVKVTIKIKGPDEKKT